MAYPTQLIPTTVVGSYPQPDWLIDRAALEKHGVPRVHAHEIWRIPEAHLKDAQDDATILAIGEMERIGIDIISDGEMRRESYSNYFSLALEGIDSTRLGAVIGANGRSTPVARVTGKISRKGPVECDDAAFLVRHATRATKITLPGPFTMAQQAANEAYDDFDELIMDFAAAVNQEARALQTAGADVIQLDEPWLRNDPEGARRIAVRAIDAAFAGLNATTAVHMCFGYAAVVGAKDRNRYEFLGELADCSAQQISVEAAQPQLDLGQLADLSNKTILLGVLDLGDPQAESAETVAQRIRAALAHVAPDKLVPAPDCGMKYLPRDLAFAKLRALSEGAALVNAAL
jgi:5-methyltetrahydropteroyltriglutamate--homocysteine methyltransferase